MLLLFQNKRPIVFWGRGVKISDFLRDVVNGWPLFIKIHTWDINEETLYTAHFDLNEAPLNIFVV